MKPTSIIVVLLLAYTNLFSQTNNDLFKPSTKITWLGVDYSHVQLIGTFAQFEDAGEQDLNSIRDNYFPAWNKLILDERTKYDIQGMLNKDNIYYDIQMITELNSKTPVEDLETLNQIEYTTTDINDFVANYSFEPSENIGIVFIAECLNKSATEAFYHFVAIDMSNNSIIMQERLKGKPGGFGLRNYWAGSIYSVIKQIRNKKYAQWMSEAHN